MGSPGNIGNVQALFTADTRSFDVSVEGTGQQLKAAAQMADQAAITIASAGEKIDRTAALQERAAERARRAWERELIIQDRVIQKDQETARAKELAALKADMLARSLQDEARVQHTVADATERVTGKTHEARGAMALLGEETGVKLPRHVRSFLAEMPAVGTAMAAVFSTTAFVAIGVAIVEAGERLYEFGKEAAELGEKLGTNWLEGAIYQLTGVGKEIKHLDEQISGFDRDIDSIIKKRKEQMVEDTRAKQGPMAAANLEAADLQTRARGNEEVIKGLQKRLEIEEKIAAIPGVGKTPLQHGQYTREQALRAEARAAGVATDPNVAAAEAEKTRKEIERYKLEADELRQDAGRKVREAAKREAEGNDRTAKETARGGSVVLPSVAPNPWAAIDKPNMSTFLTPFHDLAQRLHDEQLGYAKDDARQAEEQGKVDARNFAEWLQTQQTNGISDVFGAQHPNVQLAEQLNPAIAGARKGLDELAAAFSDTAAMTHDLVVRSANDFNDTAVGKVFGDKGASWGKMFSDIGHQAARSGLQQIEGLALGKLGFGKHDGSSAQSALYVVDVSGAPGTAVPGAGGLMGKFGNWLGGAIHLPGFAGGGEIPSNMPSLVGESGPEIFMPRSGGTIIPNDRIFGGGGHTWNIDARGTDPALTRANFERALQMTYHQAVADASRAMHEQALRRPR